MILPRPEERVPVNLDMRVWGMGADGRAFSQRARAHNISGGGALLCQIEHDLRIGDTIGVQAGEKKSTMQGGMGDEHPVGSEDSSGRATSEQTGMSVDGVASKD